MTVEAVAQAIENAGPADKIDWGDCPVKPLGHRSGNFYFVDPAGQLRILRAGDYTSNGIASLFLADTRWLEDNFPYRKNDKVVDFDTNWVTKELMRQCRKKGLFDTTLPLRGPGVWAAGGRRIIFHAGDAISRPYAGIGRMGWEAVGVIAEGGLYAAAPKIKRPDYKSASTQAGQHLMDALRLWRFVDPAGADLVCGQIGQGMLGDAGLWRSHIMIKAEPGAGKSTLLRLVRSAYGSLAQPDLNDFTEAGLRQAFSGSSRAIILDEMEGADETDERLQQVVRFLRKMSGKGGLKSTRGGASGESQAFDVTAAAFLIAVLPPPLLPQDHSRITLIEIKAPDDASAGLHVGQRAEDIVDEIAKISPALQGQVLRGWNRYHETFSLYKTAIVGMGATSRQGDQLASLLTGRDLILHDTPPTLERMEPLLRRCEGILSDFSDDMEENSEGRQCLDHLMSYMLDVWQAGRRITTAQLILRATRGQSLPVEDDVGTLGAYGIRVGYEPCPESPAPQLTLYVANRSNGLERIFSGTRWGGGKWVHALRYLKHASPTKTIRIGGEAKRATCIRHQHLPKEEARRR